MHYTQLSSRGINLGPAWGQLGTSLSLAHLSSATPEVATGKQDFRAGEPAVRQRRGRVSPALPSTHLLAALGTELGSSFNFGPAAGTFIFRPQGLAALGAEFGALRTRAAMRAERRRFAGEVDLLGEVLLPDLFLDLFDGGLRLGCG